MAKFPTPITEENFSAAAGFLKRAEAKIKRKDIIRKIAQPIGSILFAFLSFVLIYGACYRSSSPKEQEVIFQGFGFLTNVFNKLWGLDFGLELKGVVKWLVLIACNYVIPLLVSAVIAIVVSLCVRPKKANDFEGTISEKAKKLHEAAVGLKGKDSNSGGKDAESAVKVLFILVVIALFVYGFIKTKIKFQYLFYSVL